MDEAFAGDLLGFVFVYLVSSYYFLQCVGQLYWRSRRASGVCCTNNAQNRALRRVVLRRDQPLQPARLLLLLARALALALALLLALALSLALRLLHSARSLVRNRARRARILRPTRPPLLPDTASPARP